MYKYLKLSVIEIDDSKYPSVAYCNFLDLNEKVISITEKLDILTSQNIRKNNLPLNDYLLKCRILEEYENSYKIDISDPYGVLDSNNNFIFIVNKSMLEHYEQLLEIRTLRNILVHELDKVLFEGMPQNLFESLKKLIEIRKHSSKEWYLQVELPTSGDAEFDNQGNVIIPDEVLDSPDIIYDIIYDTVLK